MADVGSGRLGPSRAGTLEDFPQLLPSIIYGTEIEFYDQT
jgi:hypothetical protein